MPRTVQFAANELLRAKLPAWRSHLLMGLLAVSFLSLILRVAYLQTVRGEFLSVEGAKRYTKELPVPATRGRILDRNGTVLASSLPAWAVVAFRNRFDAPPQKFRELARLLEIDEAELRERIRGADRNFVYLKRQVEADAARRINELDIPGLELRDEFKRHYPHSEVLAHVVGFTNVEDVGQEGFELSQQPLLAQQVGKRRVIRDNLGRTIDYVESVREPQDGRDLELSIDTKIQYLAHSALRDAVREHRAKAGAVVVIDARSGEVLALSNWPTYDPNDRQQLSGAQLRNRVITDTFEPGSTLKPFTAALALELGKVRPQTTIETGQGRIRIGRHTIGDTKRHGLLTVEEIVQKSSNVGTVKMALELEPRQMWELYMALGFGQPPRIGFPGAVAGRVRPYKSWKPIEQATMSYGHGISVSLLQLARAYSVFARDGELLPVTMFRSDVPPVTERVLRPETARAVRRMLELAAGPQGTAPQAQIAGYRVAGKTGTAHKQENGRYTNKYIASFVGFAPVSNPRVIVAVMIDEPSAGQHYGGQVAAPVFSRIVGDTLRALRVPPDAPFTNLFVPSDPPKESA